MSFWLPEQGSTIASEVDMVWWFIQIICTICFIGIIATMLYFVRKYRREVHPHPTSQTHGSFAIEFAWSAIPAVLLLMMFVMGFSTYLKLQVPPNDTYDIRVFARQWGWTFKYPTGVQSDNLVVPAGQAVKLTMSSADVIHSLFIPDFRVKQDVVPNRYSVIWFQADEPGTHDLTCTEYCGKDHSRMVKRVEVKPPAEFKSWIESGGGLGDLDPVALGETLYKQYACNACHSLDGTRLVGPTFKGIFGREEKLADGSTITVDENYIRESIYQPNAKVVAGFPAAMTPFAGVIPEAQIDPIIEFLKAQK